MAKHIFHVMVNSIVKKVIQTKNGLIKHDNVNVKIIISSKKIIEKKVIKKYW